MTFYKRSEASDVARVLADNIKDRVVLITGVTITGVGFATAKAIAENQPKVMILVGRNEGK